MLSKEEINKIYEILSCDNCSISYACEACDITWADKNLIKKYIDQLEQENKNFKEFFIVTGGKDIEDITATQYIKIKQEGYIQGRIEEQDKLLKCINKLNKMIDEMSKWIYEKDYNSQEIMLICERNEDYYSNNIEKIKQHFEKKVEEKNLF